MQWMRRNSGMEIAAPTPAELQATLGYMQAHICSTARLEENGMWMDYESYGMGWHWLGWLGMAFFWLIPILLVLAAVKYLMGGRRSNIPDGERKPEALVVLEERYARGEIEREEYLQKRDDLQKK